MLVLRRGWSFIALSLVVLIAVFVLNYEPVVGTYPWLRPIRTAVNACTPIMAAVLVDVFVQGVGPIYRIFENAVAKHLEELNMVAKEFLKRVEGVDRPAYFAKELPNVVGSYMLYMHVEAPLCSSYRDIKSMHRGLVEDMGVHWSSVGEVLKSLDRVCHDIDRHNSRIREVEQRLREYLREIIERDVVPKLREANLDHLDNFVSFVLLYYVIPEIVNSDKNFSNVDRSYIESVYRSATKRFEPEPKDNGLWIGSFNVGAVELDAWRSSGEELVVDAIYKVLREYSSDLDKLVDEGKSLIKRSEDVACRLKEELERIASAGILPLTKLCRYLR